MLLRPTLLLAFAASVLAAHAQTTFSRPQMRDYDQRRANLPGNGSMYCVPTSYVDLYKYMAANGMSGMDAAFGNSYSDITTFIFVTGLSMGTDAEDGTTGSLAWSSASTWISQRSTGQLVYQWGYGPDFDWGINTIRNAVRSGSLLRIGYGRYRFIPSESFWRRQGGHAVVVSGYDWSSTQRKLVVNDPASDDGDLNTQGSFTFDVKDTSNITLTTENHGSVTHARYTNWTGSGGDRRAVVDSMHQILPVYAGWPTGGRNTEIVTKFPWHFQDTSVFPQPPSDVTYRTAQPAVAWCYDLGELALYYATSGNAIIRVDLLDRTETAIATLADPIADLVVGGTTLDLYVLSKGTFQDRITVVDRDTGRPSSRTLPSRAVALDFDAKQGGPALLDTATDTVITYNENLTSFRRQNLANMAPGRFAIASDVFFKIDHTTGDALIAERGGRTITRYMGDGPTRFSRTIPFRLSFGISAIMPADGGVIVLQDGNSLKTYNADGATFTTQLTNLPVSGPFKMARSMYAVKPGITDGPDWVDVPPVGNEP